MYTMLNNQDSIKLPDFKLRIESENVGAEERRQRGREISVNNEDMTPRKPKRTPSSLYIHSSKEERRWRLLHCQKMRREGGPRRSWKEGKTRRGASRAGGS